MIRRVGTASVASVNDQFRQGEGGFGGAAPGGDDHLAHGGPAQGAGATGEMSCGQAFRCRPSELGRRPSATLPLPISTTRSVANDTGRPTKSGITR